MAANQAAIHKFKYPGAVDADGHILEAADLWDNYAEAKYKPTAVRITRDAEGVQNVEIQGRPSKFMRGASLGTFAGMGLYDRTHFPDRGLQYGQDAPPGAMDAKERLERLDQEGLAAAIIYPTLGLCWETECDDIDYAQAMTRAYNRWVVDWCKGSGGRLIPVAHLSLGDPAAAARELERAVKDGCQGGWVVQFTMTRKPHAHPDHDVLFAKAQELGVPLGLHPSLEPPWALPGRYSRESLHGKRFFLNVTASDAIRHAFTSFFQFGTFDRFPQLKLVVLEVGAGWISYWLDRLDAVYESWVGANCKLKEKPSYYFRRNCWISADPDEHSLPAMMDLCGSDRFFWASDFPHADHPGNYIEELTEMADKLSPEARTRVLRTNVLEAYNCKL